MILLVALLTLPLTMGAVPSSRRPPVLPETAIIAEAYVLCPGDVIVRREYNLFGSPQWMEALTYSVERDGKQVVLVYIEYPEGDENAKASRILVIPEDEEPMEMTMAELQGAYPHPCMLVKPRA